MNWLKALAAGLAMSTLVHAAAPNPAAFELVLVDLKGQKKVLGTLPTSVFAPRVAPDGKRVAFELADAPAAANAPEFVRLYVADLGDLEKRKALQTTVTSQRHMGPVWSPDGDWIAFVAMGNGADALYIERSDAWIQPKYLLDGRAPEGIYRGGHNDGGVLVFLTRKDGRDYGISMLDLNSRQVTPLIDQPRSEQHSSHLSPDSRWIAYASNETGRHEVWVEPMPPDGRRVQLTREGGAHPLWSPDGRTIYFDRDGKLFRMELNLAGGTPQPGAVSQLPITGFQQGDLRRQYDLMPDGQSFLMLFPVRGASN